MRSFPSPHVALVLVLASASGAQNPCPGSPTLLYAPRYDFLSWDTLVTSRPAAAVGDLDGDGKPDYVVRGHWWYPILEVHLNQGNGVMGRYDVALPVSNTIISTGLALGDVDHDGDLDLIAVSQTQTQAGGAVYFCINDGHGLLQLEPAGQRLAGSVPGVSVCATDLDGDGWVDLFIGMTDPNNPRVYLNDRGGHFVDVTFTHLPWAIHGCAQHVIAVDLDNDGDQDLAIARGGACGAKQDSVVLYNDGRGHLTPFVLRRTSPEWHRRVSAGDLDGDGLPELVFSSYSSPIEIWRNFATSFVESTNPLPPSANYAGCAAVLDVDEDGRNDLVVCGSTPQGRFILTAYVNQGGLSFQEDASLLEGGTELQAYALFPADMDADGDTDLVVAGHYPFPYFPWGLKVLMHRHRHILPAPAPTVGMPWPIELWAWPGQFVVPALAGGTSPFDLGALGVFGLDPATTVLLPPLDMPTCHRTLSIPIPNRPVLRGHSLYWQALVLDPMRPSQTHLTNWTHDVLQ